MPFGVFKTTSLMQQKEKKQKPEKYKDSGAYTPGTVSNSQISEIHIMLVGRTVGILSDFLCSFKENMTSALHDEGFTFFSMDAVLSLMDIDTKKRIENFFWTYKKDATYVSSTEELNATCSYSICPSGKQEKLLNLVFHCCQFQNSLSFMDDSINAVWFIADETAADSSVSYDAYRDYLKSAVNNAVQSENSKTAKPVCVLLAQIEKFAHFDKKGQRTYIPTTAEDQLFRNYMSSFGNSLPDTVAVIPIQIYGGLEYKETDEQGRQLLGRGSTGYYQSYIPENCQIPAVYTLNTIIESTGVDYFLEIGGLRNAICSHLAKAKGSTSWTPCKNADVKEL